MAAPYPNQAVEDDEDGIEDSSRLFTTAARDLLGGARKGLRSFFRYKRRIQFFALVGRNVTTDTQAIDAIVSPFGRVRTEIGGLSALLDTGSVPGTTSASVTLAADGFTYEIWGFVQSYVCDATAATRTTISPTFRVLGALFATAMVNSVTQYVFASTLALTASQDGAILLESGGVEMKNLNGTITFVTSRWNMPYTVLNDGSFIINFTAATNSVAGDSQRVVIIGRRVA